MNILASTVRNYARRSEKTLHVVRRRYLGNSKSQVPHTRTAILPSRPDDDGRCEHDTPLIHHTEGGLRFHVIWVLVWFPAASTLHICVADDVADVFSTTDTT